ncbi:MAG: cytochrome c3 family protein [Terriglobia bacterium]
MNSRSDSKLRPLLVVGALLLAVGPFTGQTYAQRMPEAAHGPSVASQAPMLGKASDYVGWETCAGCHSAEAQSFAKTPHAPPSETSASAKAPSMSVQGCETCHGPGKAHAEAEEQAAGDSAKETAGAKLIFSFHASPKENSERCLTCHVTGKNQEGFAHSQHLAAGVSCDECHAPHLVKEVKDQSKGSLPIAQAAFFQVPELPETVRWLHSSLLKASEPNLCFTCHGNIQAQFALPVHHRVPEGLMKCTDCHNPHGSINRSSLNATQWETCVKCHVEKRGPYVYEHAAVRVEGCVICHSPHGNTNHFMLVRREGRQLCLQCHTGFHAQAAVPHSRLGFQTSGECTRCHVAIHGSELDANFLR